MNPRLGAISDKIYFMFFSTDRQKRYSGNTFFCVKAGPELLFADNHDSCARQGGGAEMMPMIGKPIIGGVGGVAETPLTP